MDPHGPESWPKAARLRRRPEFLRVQESGRRWSGVHLSVWFRSGAPGPARVGITVSRRVGGAVVRNRVKRWLREAFRRSYASLPPLDIVCIAKPSSVSGGWPGLRGEVVRFCVWLSALPVPAPVSR